MFWVVQNDVFNEERYAEVISTLEAGGIPYTTVKVIPFSHEMIPHPEVDGPVAVIGSWALVKRAHKLGWGPGVFFTENIRYEVYAEKFGEHMLNHGASVQKFGDVFLTETSFIRPVDDGKAFAGMVITPLLFEEWRRKVCAIEGYKTVNDDTVVVVAPVKEIYSEYRFFIVDNKIASASRYKLNDRLSPSEDVPEVLTRAAEELIMIWQPAKAFVMDLALTDEGVKIVEFNTINCSGWYHANVSKIIQAIDAIV